MLSSGFSQGVVAQIFWLYKFEIIFQIHMIQFDLYVNLSVTVSLSIPILKSDSPSTHTNNIRPYTWAFQEPCRKEKNNLRKTEIYHLCQVA